MNDCTCKELETANSPSIGPSIAITDKQVLLDTLLEPDVSNDGLGPTSVAVHNIDTGTSSPIQQYPRRLPSHFCEDVDAQVTDMLAQGIVQPSTSPWSSPIVLVKKDGSYRFVLITGYSTSKPTKDANQGSSRTLICKFKEFSRTIQALKQKFSRCCNLTFTAHA